ncbi:hypothetical protein [Microbacterium gorillae]|uniref:hypothetical protein n=1 Tax=Microbacterium gorillae TaxID=1231063 RepID=UPI003D95C054
MMTLPEPACTLGYTATQLGEILGDGVDVYRAWAVGKTQGVCEGEPWCTEPHGIVHFERDVTRFKSARARSQ